MRTTIKQIFGLISIAWIFVGCAEDPLIPKGTLTDGINIRIGDHLLITSDDIETFDLSTKYFYINERLVPQLAKNRANTLIWIYADKEVVYSGELSYPRLIQCTSANGELLGNLDYSKIPNNVLCFKYGYYTLDSTQEQTIAWPDITKYDKFIEVLQRTGKIREGIRCTLLKGKIENDTDLNLIVRFTNNDPIDYYVIDPTKVKDQSLEFSTAPLVLYNPNDLSKRYYSNPPTSLQRMGNKEHTSLLTLLKSGESIELPIYCHDINIPAGVYRTIIKYPGLTNNYDTTLNTDTTRVWSGFFYGVQDVEVE